MARDTRGGYAHRVALSSSTLSGLIRTKLLAAPSNGPLDNAALTVLCDAVAQAVVEHVLAAAVVNVTVNTITACGSGAGTGSGSGTGAIT